MIARQPAKLLCIGDIDMDIIVRVAHPPGADEKISGFPVARSPGGMAANVAVGARRLGTAARLAGAVGDDAMGREALERLRQEGLDLSAVVERPGVPTFFCLIMVDDSGEKSLVKVLSEAYLPRPSDLTAETFDGIAHTHLTVADAALSRRAVALALQAGAKMSLDLEASDLPKQSAPIAELISSVDVLFINTQSHAELTRRFGSLPVRPGAAVITTLGAEGVRLDRAGAAPITVAGHRVMPTDTTGAGDAFAAAFLHAQLEGAEDTQALTFANAAAALSTSAFGAQVGLPSAADVLAFLASGDGPSASWPRNVAQEDHHA